MKNYLVICLLVLFFLQPAAAPASEVGIDVEWEPIAGSDSSSFLPPNPGQTGQTWIEPATGMEFVWIPGGCFTQGTPTTERGRYHDEGPQRKICVDGFWMGRTEVTNLQFRHYKITHDSMAFKGHSLNADQQPVVYVSWRDAMAFCDWLTEQSGFKHSYTLPTEGQWEYACRAGTATSRYWGNSPVNACNFANMSDKTAREEWKTWTPNKCDDGYAVSAPVATFQPNAFGLYDMLGNTWEWCRDWKGKYPEKGETNPTGPSSSELGKIVRGGSWDNAANGIRCGNRSYATIGFERYNNGFRVIRIR
ncbi:protein of unknown function DUF323 [Desulfatibacillum aliphaticivorans]|uniref:Sulfatase-modifying factor enzyme-like domain-containing protein n=1 Tax=Desulfatibacillum aliphaticivorans TaxID=218208 RepID=B8FIS9_DESAL|nr:formylglycine-generating enzyme family protein [Desulfatibacillum aliphaticivorans]ACL04320.1 protein of unknown function DUF323 [Desulfatibacillum aliphaticivorans]